MSIASVRADIAAALSAIGGVNVRAYPVASIGYGDGWVSIASVTTGEFLGSDDVAFEVHIGLGVDQAAAEQRFEALAPLVIHALAEGNMIARDVRVSPVALIVGTSSTPVPALTAAFTMEVERA